MMNAEFFLVALPGLEDLVAAELAEWFPDLSAETQHGGVAVTAPLDIGLGFNFCLKTPTRVMVRLKRFRCRDFPKLYQTVMALPWFDFVPPECRMVAHASTRLSRLKIKSRIESTCVDAWKKIAPAAKGPEFNVYVRLVDDECTISLDTSGERLHKRGVRTHVGEAPLRETIAAALVRMVRTHAEGVTEVEVVDPMAGSGTFLLEAATAHRLIDQREFAPLKITARKPAAREGLKVTRLIGFERDEATVKAARVNLAGLTVDFRDEDIFTAEPLPAAAGARWLFVNPPYGERLRVDEPLPAYYAKLFAACARVAAPDLVCALLPAAGAKGRLTLPTGWRVVEKRPFVNGGIPVVAFVFRTRA